MILQDLTYEELLEEIKALNLPSFRAKQIYENIYLGKTIEDISNIPKDLKQKLLEKYENEPVKIEKIFTSKDTIKFIYKLYDNNIIEGVVMSYKYGNTICVSTQVGCRMGCKFCASTLNGLVRNLSAGEILSQVLVVNKYLGGDLKNRKITNIVLMGSGEPLDNYDNTIKFLKLVSSENGINISPRNISLSTCGIVPKIYELAKENLPITLTISLHAPNDEIRKETMPIANRYSYKELIDAVRHYSNKTGRRIVFEYALIHGKNDSFKHAEELSKIKGFSYHFNLIPLNYVKERNLEGTPKKQAYAFMNKLNELGVSATVRRTMGEDIGGACGQLRNSILND